MSDSDKMRAEFEKWAEDNDCGITLAATSATGFYTRNIAWTAWQAAYAAGQKSEREAIFIEWENGEIMAAEVERLRAELELSKANVESLKKALFEVQEAAIRLGDQVDDARQELALAKAASACPVITIDCYTVNHEIHIACRSLQDCHKLSLWLRDRMKDNTPPKA